jgi:hypothetical protein
MNVDEFLDGAFKELGDASDEEGDDEDEEGGGASDSDVDEVRAAHAARK